MKVALKFTPKDCRLSKWVIGNNERIDSLPLETNTDWYLLVEESVQCLPIKSRILDYTEDTGKVEFMIEKFEYNIPLTLCTITVKVTDNTEIGIRQFEDYILSDWFDWDQLYIKIDT